MAKVEIDLITDGNTHWESPEFGRTKNFASIFIGHGLKWTFQFEGPGGGATVYSLEGEREIIIRALEEVYECTYTYGDWNCPVAQAIECAEDVGTW